MTMMTMINENGVYKQTVTPSKPDYDKFNFVPHVLNLLNIIHSDGDVTAVSQEVYSNFGLG